MSAPAFLALVVAYIAGLLGGTYLLLRRRGGERSEKRSGAAVTYALSLGVYCTGWTYYGSVGLAAEGGWGFLPVYLGPTLSAAVWLYVLRKLILVSKHHRASSVPDLLAARFEGDRAVGMLATAITVLAVIPYISIQLKVIAESFALLTLGPGGIADRLVGPLASRPSFYLTLAIGAFAVAVGARRLDPNVRSEGGPGGLATALALESVFKLFAFLAVGFYVVYGVYGGWGELWEVAGRTVALDRWMEIGGENGLDSWSWWWLNAISASAVLLLPRQFYVAVVENRSPDHVATAAWVFPLYLLLINAFVVPLALAGLARVGDGIAADFHVLALPLEADAGALAGLVALGGLSAATAMIVVSSIALSLMLVNNVISPLLLARPEVSLRRGNLPTRLLGLRRVAIAALLVVSYGYYLAVAERASLISIGLISFAGIAQLAPTTLATLYWPRLTRAGALAGLSLGALVWAYTLPFATLIDARYFGGWWSDPGPFGYAWLSPGGLLGIVSGHPVARAAFWSLLVNVGAMVWVSLKTRQPPAAAAKADEFVHIERYITLAGGGAGEVGGRQATTAELLLLLHRYLGSDAAIARLDAYERRYGIDPRRSQVSSERFVGFVERHLAGAIGSPSARLAISSVARGTITTPLLRSLDETRELQAAFVALERQRLRLEHTADELREANERLRQLDQLKEEFVATVTHELRTPITSIRALSQLLAERDDLDPARRREFHRTVVAECDRVSRLVSQVLGAQAVERIVPSSTTIVLEDPLRQAMATTAPLAADAGVTLEANFELHGAKIHADADRIVQVLVNLLGNAVKHTQSPSGAITLSAWATGVGVARIEVRDNGSGIPPERQASVFEKFAQADFQGASKPVGNGLGLYISRAIVERYGGRIGLRSLVGRGTTVWIELPLLDWDRTTVPVVL